MVGTAFGAAIFPSSPRAKYYMRSQVRVSRFKTGRRQPEFGASLSGYISNDLTNGWELSVRYHQDTNS